MRAYPSRYIRPTAPRAMVLRDRDRDVLRYVYKHRYLTSDHIRTLLFHKVSMRVVQRRLRLLFENGYLDRYFAPVVLTGTRASARQSPRPIYSLGRMGADMLRSEMNFPPGRIPCTPQTSVVGYATLEHHLVATDFFVALEAACLDRGDIALVAIERESKLRVRIDEVRRARALPRFIVSDGAFTLRYPSTGKTLSYHLEVVRALAKSGNQSIAAKLAKYAALHHRGFFRDVFGHELRAVLFMTTSEERGATYRRLAEELPHGKRLFWFTCYGKEMRGGVPRTQFTPTSIFAPVWHLPDDTTKRSLLNP